MLLQHWEQRHVHLSVCASGVVSYTRYAHIHAPSPVCSCPFQCRRWCVTVTRWTQWMLGHEDFFPQHIVSILTHTPWSKWIKLKILDVWNTHTLFLGLFLTTPDMPFKHLQSSRYCAKSHLKCNICRKWAYRLIMTLSRLSLVKSLDYTWHNQRSPNYL